MSEAQRIFQRLKSKLEPDKQKQERQIAADKVVREVRGAAVAAGVKVGTSQLASFYGVGETFSYELTIGNVSAFLYALEGTVYVNKTGNIDLDNARKPKGWTPVDLDFDQETTSYRNGVAKAAEAIAEIIDPKAT